MNLTVYAIDGVTPVVDPSAFVHPTAVLIGDVIVGPGDTLWSIASPAAPDRDPRAVIEEIRELNNFSDSVLPVGVALRVPVSVE